LQEVGGGGGAVVSRIAGGMAFQAGRGGAAEEAPRHFGFLCGQNGNLFWNIGEGLARKGLEEPHQFASSFSEKEKVGMCTCK